MLLPRWLCGRPRSASARTPCRRLITPERLESRDLPSGLGFQFIIDDPGHQFDQYPLLRTDLDAVGQILSGVVDGLGTIQVRVRADNSIPRSQGTTIGVFPAGSSKGRTVWESAALAEARTGVNPNGSGPEVDLAFNAQSFLPTVWFDPTGAARTAPVPTNRVDFISLALHEMMHGFGFTGYRVVSGPGTGSLPAGYESSYDALTAFGTGASAGQLSFYGWHAMAVYGGPVPLTSVGASGTLASQNFYHLGNPAGRGADLIPDLMNGVVFSFATRYTVSTLDRAMLADLGWYVPGFTESAAPVLPPRVVAPRRRHRRPPPHPHQNRPPHRLPRLVNRPHPLPMLFRLA
jgi:hypothetical protein